jgi:ATP/maltotriose-dependent transcriptional regulator MalT
MAERASVLVGRQDELAAFGRALAEIERGRAHALALRGEPGIGKSRLLGELASRARERDVRVLDGRAAELERDLTFALLVDALEPLARDPALADPIRTLEEQQLRELTALLPAIGPLAGAEAAPASGERHRVARAVRALLERVAAERPLALLLDDVHWADPASADVLALLLHRPPRAGVLLALAARTRRAPGLDAALAAAEQQGAAEVLEVGPLPLDVVGELLPDAGLATRERLYRESGGNPFYLQELARARRSEVGRAAGAGLAGVPAPVRAALAGEVAALSADARLVLEGAAVVGDPFEPALAAVAADVVEAVALAALDELVATDLVRPTAEPRRFRFRHPLVRRAVYEGAGGGWRLAAHARAADSLAARGATPAQRAHHVERAAQPGDLAGVDLLVAAAEEVVLTAPATAAGWYEAALRLLPETGAQRPRRLALLGAQGQALASAGRPAEARDVLRRVLAMTPPAAVEHRVRLVEAIADLEALWLHRREDARRLVETEREALGAGTPGLAAALSFALVRERAASGDHQDAERLAGEARAAARAAGDPVLEAAAAVLEADAAHCALLGDDAAALAAVDAKIAHASALVDALPDERAAERLQMLFWLGVARLFTGSFEQAHVATERGLRLARSTRQGLLAPSFLGLRGFIHEEVGDLDRAERDVDESLESAILTGNGHLEYWTVLVAAWIALARGKAEAALSYGERGWELAGVVPWSQVGWTVAEARLALGDARRALDVLETFGGVNPGLWTLDRLKALDVLVRVLLALDRVEEAAEWADRAPGQVGGRRSGVFGAVIAHAHASVLLAQAAAPEAARVALAGAIAADEGDAALWAGRCRTLAGEALAACGRTDEALTELRRAAAELEALGAWGYRDAALRGLRRLGERPRPAAVPASAGADRLSALTAREREVALLVGGGQTNAQIAARLHLSESTVEKHVSRVLAKLGLSSRAGVVALLARERVGAP